MRLFLWFSNTVRCWHEYFEPIFKVDFCCTIIEGLLGRLEGGKTGKILVESTNPLGFLGTSRCYPPSLWVSDSVSSEIKTWRSQEVSRSREIVMSKTKIKVIFRLKRKSCKRTQCGKMIFLWKNFKTFLKNIFKLLHQKGNWNFFLI